MGLVRRLGAAGSSNPAGLVILIATALTTVSLFTIPALAALSDRAAWVFGWGVVGYLMTLVISARPSRTRASPPPASSVPSAQPVGAFPDGLTGREVEVLCLLAQGLSNKEIARHPRIMLSIAGVESHIAHIYNKASVHNRVEAANYARRYALCTHEAPRSR